MKDTFSKIVIIIAMLSIFLAPSLPYFVEELSYVLEEWESNPLDYARITDIDYRAVVMDVPDGDGRVHVTQRVTFDVHSFSRANPFWELWLDLPEYSTDGVTTAYDVISVTQILDNGTRKVWEESYKLYWEDYDYLYGPEKWYYSPGPYSEYLRQYECIFFYLDGVYRDELTFEIEYEMTDAVLKYNDCCDLYLLMFEGGNMEYLESFTAEILFPNEDMPAAGNYDVFTYGTAANDFPVTESAYANPGYYTFSIDLDKNELKTNPYNQYLEFELVAFNEDKNIFAEYAGDNAYSSENVLPEVYAEQQEYANTPKQYAMIKLLVLLIALLFSAVITVLVLLYKRLLHQKHYFFEPSIDTDTYRDIPSDLDPKFAADLVFCRKKEKKKKDNDADTYSAILLSLARKKYIALQDYDNDDMEITILYNPPASQNISPSGTNAFGSSNVFGSLGSSDTFGSFGSPDTFGSFGSTDTFSSPEPTVEPTPSVQLEPLTLNEERYFNLLTRHAYNNRITMKYLQTRMTDDYDETNAFANRYKLSTVNIGVKDGYFQKADYKAPCHTLTHWGNFLIVCGIILAAGLNLISYHTRLDFAYGAFFIMGFVCVIMGMYLKHVAPKYVLLTQFGEDEYVKWRGLYNFLNSDTLMNERTYIELPIWERYLVYATAFGISEKVSKAINFRCPEGAESPVISTYHYNSVRIRHSGRSFRSSVRSSSHIARSGGFSSYSGSRSGYGGGGGH